MIDYTLITRVFVNLISNSLNAIRDHQKSNIYLSGTVRISSRIEDDKIWVIIEDNGSGIPKEKINELLGGNISKNQTFTRKGSTSEVISTGLGFTFL